MNFRKMENVRCLLGVTFALIVAVAIGCQTQTLQQVKLPSEPQADRDRNYHLVQKIVWTQGEHLVDARFEELESLSKGVELNLPLTRLTVTDLDTNKDLFVKSADDHGTLLQRGSFNVDGKQCFIAIWTGGSHDQFELYTIDGGIVAERLSEPFRDIFLPVTTPETGNTKIYLLDNSSANNERIFKKFELKNGRSQLIGEAPYQNFKKAVENAFTQRAIMSKISQNRSGKRTPVFYPRALSDLKRTRAISTPRSRLMSGMSIRAQALSQRPIRR